MLCLRRWGSTCALALAQARLQNPERIVLEGADLRACPLIEGEDVEIRLVNFKSNAITEISHLEPMTNLIFLDMYNNQVSRTVA